MNTSPEIFNHRLSWATDMGIPIAGSLGRAAILGQEEIDPYRASGSPRDVDIVNVAQYSQASNHLPIDDLFDHIWLRSFVRRTTKGHDLIYPGTYRGVPPVEPTITVPVPYLTDLLDSVEQRTVNGKTILTLRPEVQLTLDRMRGKEQPKNRLMLKLLQVKVDEIPIRNRVDPSLTEPLVQFGQEIDSLWRVRAYKAARYLYHAVLPPEVIKSTQPMIATAARLSRFI